AFGVEHGLLSEFHVTAADEVERRVPVDRDPHEDVDERDGQGAHHELADGPTAGDAGEGESEERGEGDPPGPEEQGPVGHPCYGVLDGDSLTGHIHDQTINVYEADRDRKVSAL